LKLLVLDQTQVTDADLRHLHAMTGRGVVSLRGAKATPAGVAEFRKALPNWKIDTRELPSSKLQIGRTTQ
jgi:hypothetical protein